MLPALRPSAVRVRIRAPCAGASIGPRLRERTELRFGVHNLLNDGEHVESAAREAMNKHHGHRADRGFHRERSGSGSRGGPLRC
jgi:hypothetical protein